MRKILLAEALDEASENRLASAGMVVRAPRSDEGTLMQLIGDCDALVARTHTPITRGLLEAGRRLRVVGIAGVGLDRVDLAAAESLGVAVLNTPAASSDAVAEFAVALMLQLLRPVSRMARSYGAGQFAELREKPHGPELGELTVGIVGMGRIGSRVGRICSAGMGSRVLYNDIASVGPFGYPTASVDKETLWEEADVVTLHVPLTGETAGLVDEGVLGSMKPTSYLINTARGRVVDCDALAVALGEGRLAGAALDVTDPEPLPGSHPLFGMENCILTPHVAARTHGGLRRMFGVVEQVVSYLGGAG